MNEELKHHLSQRLPGKNYLTALVNTFPHSPKEENNTLLSEDLGTVNMRWALFLLKFMWNSDIKTTVYSHRTRIFTFLLLLTAVRPSLLWCASEKVVWPTTLEVPEAWWIEQQLLNFGAEAFVSPGLFFQLALKHSVKYHSCFGACFINIAYCFIWQDQSWPEDLQNWWRTAAREWKGGGNVICSWAKRWHFGNSLSTKSTVNSLVGPSALEYSWHPKKSRLQGSFKQNHWRF